MIGLGKALMWMGAIVFLLGALLFYGDRLQLVKSVVGVVGRLPGDLSFKGNGWQVHAPLATSLLISLLLSLGFWLFSWLSNRGGS